MNNIDALGLLPDEYVRVDGDDKLRDYIGDRKVVIIGPSFSDEYDELSSDDIVVNLSTLETENSDILYVSSQFYLENKTEIESKLESDEISFVIVNGAPKNIFSSRLFGEKIFGIYPFALAKTSPLLGVNRAINDLVGRGIKNIRVCNVDWYTKYPLHNGNYPTKLVTPHDYLFSLSVHDLATNFLICQRLHKASNIECSKDYSLLIGESLENYLEQVRINFQKFIEEKQ